MQDISRDASRDVSADASEGRWMTYAELAQLRGIDKQSAAMADVPPSLAPSEITPAGRCPPVKRPHSAPSPCRAAAATARHCSAGAMIVAPPD